MSMMERIWILNLDGTANYPFNNDLNVWWFLMFVGEILSVCVNFNNLRGLTVSSWNCKGHVPS